MTSPMRSLAGKWRELAVGLGIQEKDIPAFVADQVQRELSDKEERAAKLDILKKSEAAKAEREQAEQKERLELCRREFEERHRREEDVYQAQLGVVRDSGSRTSASSSTTSLPLPHFDDSREEVSLWLKKFERVAEFSKWKRETWAVRASVCLSGKAAECYNALSDTDAKDYDKLKAALLARYQLTADVYRRRFRTSRKKDGETYISFGVRLTEDLTKWQEMSGLSSLQELVLLEQFCQTLSADMMSFVKERRPKTLRAAAEAAELYAEAHRGTPKFSRPTGHQSGVNPAMVHSRPQPNSKVVDNPPAARGSRGCFVCGETGHMARDCKKKAVKSSGAVSTLGSVVVDTVGSVPSLCGECASRSFTPRCQVQVEGTSVEALRDTGSDVCLIRRSIVPTACMTNRVRTIAFADTRCRTELPIAKVRLESPYFSGIVEAVVMDQPCADFVVGNSATVESGAMLPVYAVLPCTSKPSTIAAESVAVVTRAQAQTVGIQPKSLHVAPASKIGSVNSVELGKLQREDPSLQKFRNMADSGEVVESGKQGRVLFRWRRGVLFRVYQRGDSDEYTQVVVPKSLRRGLMELAHEPPMSGHMGGQRTLDRIWKQFFWPLMSQEIRAFVASCDACQKVSPRPQKVPLGQMPLIDTPFERVAIDLVGPIAPLSESGNRYILCVVDYATRYPEAVPLKTIDTVTVAEALWGIWTRVGVPSEVLTDRGTQFTSELMKEINRLLGVRGLTTTPYHAMCNGLVERYNATLKKMLRKLCQEQPRQWDRYIPALLFAYREAKTESLGFSPFELLYGRTVRGPMQILRELWTEARTEDISTTGEYVVELRNRIAETCEVARQNLANASERHAEVFNRKTASRSFVPGDKVLLLLPEERNKLQMCWQGPFEVIEKKGIADYRISVRGRPRLYHANLLKRYVERPERVAPDPIVAVAVIEEESAGGSTVDSEIPLVQLESEETVEDIHFGPNLSPQQKAEALELARGFQNVLTDRPLRTNLAVCDFTLESAKPVRVKQYPIPYSKVEVVNKEVKSMLEMGVVEAAASPYNAPVVLVRKKDGNVRFCIDYRKLNDVTVFDAEPLPDVDCLFSRLGSAQYFTKLDLAKGYWQIPVPEELRPVTAFTTTAGQFQFTVLPFGLKNAVAIFSRMMRALLGPLERTDVHNFMDDILVASETWRQHLVALRAVFGRLQEANLSARPKKCFLGFKELSFLGHVVRKGEMRPEEDKLSRVRDSLPPKTKKEVRAFLGMVGYYRKFVANFAAIALPLTDLTRKFKPNDVIWTPDCEKAFRALKDRLLSKPVLQLPDLSQPFVLRTDASGRGLGAVLLQERAETLHPVAFASRKLSDTEERYSTVEKECLAVVWGVQKFQAYLWGQHFVLETDHQPLKFLNTAKIANSRLMRWALQLQTYDFSVRVIPGSRNVGADYLSRVSFASD